MNKSLFICLPFFSLCIMWPAIAEIQAVMEAQREGYIIRITIHDLEALNKSFMK